MGHNGVRSWLAYSESLRFQVFSLFLICRDRTRCTAKSIRSQEDKTKKNFPYCFWFAAIAQGARQRAYIVKEGNNPRLKQKISNNKQIKYERWKKNKSVIVTLYLQIFRNGCFWSKQKWFSMKRNYFLMEMALRIKWNISHKPKMHRKSRTRNPFKVSATPVPDLDQNRKWLFIKDLIPCLGTHGTPKRPNTLSKCFNK